MEAVLASSLTTVVICLCGGFFLRLVSTRGDDPRPACNQNGRGQAQAAQLSARPVLGLRLKQTTPVNKRHL